jgi:hypothetical protein
MSRERSLEIMARVVVIGGSGHVGAYLLPALAERGFEVVKRQSRCGETLPATFGMEGCRAGNRRP